MKIFDRVFCAPIVLKNTNEYVKRAVEDLKKDLLLVGAPYEPEIVSSGNRAIIIEENKFSDTDPVCDESFSVTCDGENVVISASTYLGTMWGIYTFSERMLGVSPCYLWDDIKPKAFGELYLEPFIICEKPKGFGFRGIFINDEDLLTGWMISGGRREIDYPWYNDTVDTSVMDRVVETALRLKINLIIPATFLNIDNPPEKALADCVAKRGIYLSQHHIEPVGVSTFTFEKYCAKFGKTGEFSYIKNPELMEEVWRYYAEKWSEYDRLVWQIGLRGKIDRPVWEEDDPTEEELAKYAEFIGNAIGRQKKIIEEATSGRAKHFTSTLWMEGAKLAKRGYLALPEGVIAVFADNGPNQMYANDFYEVKRDDTRKYGIYYHLQYFGLGPHLAPLTGLDKLDYNLKLAYDKGDRAYIILNSSNIREFTFELEAYSRLTWNSEGFSKQDYLDDYASRFAEEKAAVKNAIDSYYKAIAVLDKSFLDNHHGNYFDYRYEDVDGVKNLMVKDGMTVNVCRHIVDGLKKNYSVPLWIEYYKVIEGAVPKLDAVIRDFEDISGRLDDGLRDGVAMHWATYAKTLRALYACMLYMFDAKSAHDGGDDKLCIEKLGLAANEMRELLEYRKCAERGDFENWYRGDTKLDLPRLLREIEERIAALS